MKQTKEWQSKRSAESISILYKSEREKEREIEEVRRGIQENMETLSWEQLFNRLRPILANGSAQVARDRKEEILTLLRSYQSKDSDFASYCNYNPGKLVLEV